MVPSWYRFPRESPWVHDHPPSWYHLQGFTGGNHGVPRRTIHSWTAIEALAVISRMCTVYSVQMCTVPSRSIINFTIKQSCIVYECTLLIASNSWLIEGTIPLWPAKAIKSTEYRVVCLRGKTNHQRKCSQMVVRILLMRASWNHKPPLLDPATASNNQVP